MKTWRPQRQAPSSDRYLPIARSSNYWFGVVMCNVPPWRKSPVQKNNNLS